MAMAQASGQAKAEGGSDAVRPFRVHYRMGDLKHRTAATRWPEREIVTDQSQGAPLATIQKLARYWSTEYECASARRSSTLCRRDATARAIRRCCRRRARLRNAFA
jgi:hypothetical protein